MYKIRRWFGISLFLASCLAGRAAAAEKDANALRVNEERIHFHLLPTPGLEFPVFNPTSKPVTGTFAFELVDKDDWVAASTWGSFIEQPGETVEKLDWAAKNLPSVSPSELGWYRLQYIFFPSAESGLPVTGGIVQFGRVIQDGFEIRMAAANKVEPGTQYPVRLRVLSSPDGKPLARQTIRVEMEIGNDDEKTVKRRVTTDEDGNAIVTFMLPAKPEDQEGELTATVARGAFNEETSLKFQFPDAPAPHISISTDKPLYQPGQTVHVRLMAFGGDKKAMARTPIDVTIEDEEGQEQFHQKVTTSRFGIARADWEIPSMLQLGEQRLTARLEYKENDNTQETTAMSTVRVSRYELPTYTVMAEPDRPYYLPGQDPVVDVHADYLFGKPVQHGKVQVVKQQERQWNYKDQKWEAEESDPVMGELDGEGHFHAKINVSQEFKDFQESSYQRFRDVSLAAYLTDASTGRTEQRRFNLRITSQPIHIYILERGSNLNASNLLFYVTTSYADGTPASTDGEISAAKPINEEELGAQYDVTSKTPLGHFHTNKHGIGRVELAPLPEKVIRVTHGLGRPYWDYYNSDEQYTSRNAQLVLEVRDKEGKSGEYSEEIGADLSAEYIRVRTNHTLYHPGDPIEAEITTTAKANEAIVNLWSEDGLLRSLAVKLNEGHGKLKVPFEPRFHGEIYVAAYCVTPSKIGDASLSDRRQILYPAREELGVKVGMKKAVFNPGETVSSDLDVQAPDGKAVESALGVLVYDRAVAERARTDEEFGRGYGFSVWEYFNPFYAQSIGGISYRDLLNLDASKPFPEELDLVAEGMVNTRFGPWWSAAGEYAASGWSGGGANGLFEKKLQAELQETRRVLKAWAETKSEYPHDEAEVREALRAAGIDFDHVCDPWGVAFRTVFGVRREKSFLHLVSNGIDKRPGTEDDFVAAHFEWAYFGKAGIAINTAAREYAAQTGKFIRDYTTLREEMRKRGVDLDTLRDPWGNLYRYEFDVFRNQYRIIVSSAGPDGIFDSRGNRSWDDVQEWTSQIQYFTSQSETLAKALAEQYALTKAFPQNEEALKPVLARAKLTPEQLTDPWGHPYYFTFSKRNRYSDRIDVRTYTDAAGESHRETSTTPVTQEVEYLTVLSYGEGSASDLSHSFPVAEFNRVTAERSSKDIRAIPTTEQKPLAGGRGAITGVVTDPMGAVILNATITAESETGLEYTETSDLQGTYGFSNLPSGIYDLKCWASGFVASTVLRVPVQAGDTTKVNFTLNVGGSTETVTVEAARTDLQTTAVQVSGLSLAQTVVSLPERAPGSTPAEKPLFTPKLRKYFPETLVWRPEVITDENGHAKIHFPMGDNITAWKMSVIASTIGGQIGVAEKELRSFQPFFVENDPPKVLTEGDEISQPVVLRNYLERPQTILAELKAEPWFAMLSAPQQKLTVAANGDASAVFTYRAIHSAKNAKQRVTARNTSTGDAVERELRVHPNGQEISFSTSQLIAGTQNAVKVRVPEAAIGGSIDAELRIYPSLMAHVLDAIEGIGKRPAGCAEQVTSTAYVSLMALELLKKVGQDKPGRDNPRSAIAASARAAVQEAYRKLAEAQNADGGFGYWYTWSGNSALTAYVMRFVTEAKEFIPVDENVARRARNYLVAHQVRPGTWGMYRWDSKKEVEDANTTMYVARALAAIDSVPADKKDSKEEKDKEKLQARAAVDAALHELEGRIDSWSDAYLVGNYALAAVASGRSKHIEKARALLGQLAQREGDTMYWNLEANTSPFYGWGYTGRLETTALAVEALTKMGAGHADRDIQDMISRGLQYLLSHKDRYAVWYSTQATQNVLEAMIVAMPAAGDSAKATQATVKVNGRAVKTVQLANPREASGPVTVALGDVLEKGENKIEVVSGANASAMNATVFTSYYLPWGESSSTTEENLLSGEKRALRLKVGYDRLEAKAGETVHCDVEAERIGFKGYGMMLAEVGLPPGAEVDRASLEAAKESDAGVGSYEVQPDRVVFYVWPTAGGSKFGFDFRLRYRMQSSSAPSTLYDYYNPEAAATVMPVKFSVH
jgi:uncharacterized protein YfaS (alpha-2-macroglobulin family)